MLWYKGWLETRFRLLFLLGVLLSFLLFFYSAGTNRPVGGVKPVAGFISYSVPAFVVMSCALLAGAGIATQPSFQATKGLHGSMMFTLSMPVSRFRLLAVRAGLGWLGVAGALGMLCCGMLFTFPELRARATAGEILEYAEALTTCASALYFLSVLLATLLDDQWRTWGTMISGGAIWWLSANTPLPPSFNIFRAMGEGSPLSGHSMPWTAMGFSLGLAAIFYVAALKVVQTREY
jgi:hypothetical protein